MNSKKAVLIVNPGSGRGKGRERAADFRDAWIQKFGTDISVRETKSKEDIGIAVKETFSPDSVQIFLGGDGTVSECLQALSEMEKFEKISNTVGILPAGSGNSFLRDFEITDYSSAKENLISALEKNESRDVDMALLKFSNSAGKEKTRIMFNIFGVGVVPLIAEMAMKMRFLGSLNYTFATLWKIFSHKKMKVDAVIDGTAEILESDFISICNSRYTGGAMIMAPDVRTDDGKLYLVAPSMKSKFQILGLFPKIFKGDHVSHPDVRNHFVNDIHIKSDKELLLLIDGELEKGYDPLISVKPKFWKIYVSG